MRYAVVALVLLFPSLVLAQEVDRCLSDPGTYWICKGDKAWGSGWLVDPAILTMEQVEIWKEQAELLPQVEADADLFQTQRDAAIRDAALWEDDFGRVTTQYHALATDYNILADNYAELQSALDDRFTVWEVVGWSVGAGGAGIIAGWLLTQ